MFLIKQLKRERAREKTPLVIMICRRIIQSGHFLFHDEQFNVRISLKIRTALLVRQNGEHEDNNGPFMDVSIKSPCAIHCILIMTTTTIVFHVG